MSLAQYLEMWNRINRWQSANKTTDLPNYVTVSDFKIGSPVIDKIYKATFLNMLNRVKAFQALHGSMPNVIGIEGAAIGTEPKIGPVRAKLQAGLGVFNTFTEFYNKCKGRGYSYYYNDIKTLDQEIYALVNRKGLNCTDSTQLAHALALEMGYEFRYVHVQCKSGGHIRGQIRGREFKDWTRVDMAACISVSSQYALNRVWCDYDNAHLENSAWLNTDDGRM